MDIKYDVKYIKDKLSLLPMQPGCYLMKDKEGTVIYVGKAKKLKNRVSSYFAGSHNYKTTKLVQEIVDFEYIVTDSEKEALLLEINLIKDYAHKYNISFMDNKYYPYHFVGIAQQNHILRFGSAPPEEGCEHKQQASHGLKPISEIQRQRPGAFAHFLMGRSESHGPLQSDVGMPEGVSVGQIDGRND